MTSKIRSGESYGMKWAALHQQRAHGVMMNQQPFFIRGSVLTGSVPACPLPSQRPTTLMTPPPHTHTHTLSVSIVSRVLQHPYSKSDRHRVARPRERTT